MRIKPLPIVADFLEAAEKAERYKTERKYDLSEKWANRMARISETMNAEAWRNLRAVKEQK